MKITNAGESSSKEIIGPYESTKLKEKLAAHKAEQKTVFYKLKKLFKK